jgi:hypothetical protein
MQDVVKIAKTYLEALRAKDLQQAKLAPDVWFKSPLTDQPLTSRVELESFLNGILPAVKDIRINKEFGSESDVCIQWDLVTTSSKVVPILEYFRVANGQIQEVRPFYDPRPLLGA